MQVVRTAIAAAFALALTPLVSFAQSIPTSAYAQLHWRMIGPFRGGRTVAVTGVPQQPNVFYIAAVNGGIWKTTDAGRTWTPIFDSQPSGSIGALAVAPSDPNVLYAGSGEGLRRPDLAVGDGIYKSTDAGAHWTHLGLRDGQQINGIAVDPRDPNRVFAAVVGHPYGPNAERGLYRSTDGGTTWQRVLGKDENTGAVAVVIDPSKPETMYAAMWASRVGPWHYLQAYELGGNDGLFKSTDGGTTWTKLTQGLPAKPGRIGISVSPANDRVVYAIVDAAEGCGIYRSDDAGATWQRTNREERVCGRGSDFGNVTADPKDAMTVYVPNTTTYRSTDGGKTFTGIKGAPGGDDYHTVWIDPSNVNVILLGSDQGATISVNHGATWSSWYNQPTAQFYHVITDNRFPYWVYGGQQESGSAGVVSRSDYGEISFRDWHPVGAEEYGYIAPDPLHPGIIYGGKASRYDERTGDVQDVSPAYDRKQYRFSRTMPLIFNRIDPHVLYLGSNVVFATSNGGHSWRIVSPDLTRKNPGTPANFGAFANVDKLNGKHLGVVYSLSPSYVNRDLIWAGTDDGLLWITRDGGTHWKNVTPSSLTPWSKVAQIDSSHFDTSTAYAAVNRFRLDDLRPYIYRTHDGGKTWQKITSGLPNEPVNTVREDPKRRGLLYAGTERTVYVSFDDGNRWEALQNNLPPTSIRDLVVHGDDLVIGTHGRSFWILDDVAALREFSPQTLSAAVHLFKPQLTYRLRRDQNTDTPLPPEEPAGENPPDGAIFDYVVSGSVPVTVTIRDARGNEVRRFSSTDTPEPIDPEIVVPTYWVRPTRIPATGAGTHRFVWDLHYAAPKAASHSYPISAIHGDTPRVPQGALALPGRYTVTVDAGGRTSTQTFELRMDPRMHVTPQALQAQFALAQRIVDGMNRSYRLMELAKAKKDAKAEDRFSSLNDSLAQMLDAVEGGDAAPTVQAIRRTRSLLSQLP